MKNQSEPVSQSRRNFVSLLASVPLAWQLPLSESSHQNKNEFPVKDQFSIKGTYINAAYTHPMSKGSFNEVQKFLNVRMLNRQEPKGYDGFERNDVAAS